MAQGQIKTIVVDRGFGFIAGENGEVFFHHSALQGGARFEDLQEGRAVEYTESNGPKGPRAENVTVL